MLGEAFKKNGLNLSMFSVSQKRYKYKNAVDKRTKNMKITPKKSHKYLELSPFFLWNKYAEFLGPPPQVFPNDDFQRKS